MPHASMSQPSSQAVVSEGLRKWFVLHFVADLVFAVPLLVAPRAFLGALGWTCVDPISARLVGAALAAIGIESVLVRGEGPRVFRAMLTLKVIWSACATVGILASQLQGGPALGWAFLVVFAVFNVVWTYYLRGLRAPAGP